MRVLVVLLFTALMSSCSQQVGKTPANFKLSMGALGTPAEFPGGLIVYGRTVSGSNAFGKIFTNGISADEEIQNGVWHFYAIGWDNENADGPMTGKVYCGKLMDVNLNGNPTEVSLVTSNQNCSQPEFSSMHNVSGNEIQFPEIQVETCKNLEQDMSYDSGIACSYVSTPGAYVGKKGYAGSYKIFAQTYTRLGVATVKNPSEILMADGCSVVDSATGAGGLTNNQFINLNLPTGNLNIPTPFAFTIRAYYTADCSEDKGFTDITLRNGTHANEIDVKSAVWDDGGTKRVKIYARTNDSDVCSDVRLSNTSFAPHGFAAGFGTTGHPYVICTPRQLNTIGWDFENNMSTGYGYHTNSFILGADIDMISETNAFAAAPMGCIGMGDNLYPLGGYTTGECASDNEANPIFSGTFDGNYKTVSNMSMTSNSLTMGGFTRQLDGTLINLTIKDAEVEGVEQLGIAAGYCNGCKISNVTIRHSKIRADGNAGNANAGLVVGATATNSDLDSLYVYDSHIEAYGGKIGGIVGDMTGTDFTKGLAENVYVVNSEMSTFNVGGAVGFMTGGTLSKVGVKGYVSNQGRNTGGVVGKTTTAPAPSITHVYSNVYLDSQDPALANAGGIVGSAVTGTTVQYGFAAGMIRHSCTANDATCKIGGVIGDDSSGTVTPSDIFVEANTATLLASLGGQNGVVTKDYTALRDINNDFYTSDILTNWNGAAPNTWTMQDGMLPRFEHEPWAACQDLTNVAALGVQVAGGRGTAENPITICKPEQLGNIPIGSDKYIKLMEPLRIGQVTNAGMIKSFNGTFNGNMKLLFGMTISNGLGATGLFQEINQGAVVKNLRVYGASISAGTTSNGIIAGINNGQIEFANVILKTDGIDYVGAIAGTNNGTIYRSESWGMMKGQTVLGGIAAYNNHRINQSRSNVKIVASANGLSYVGGIAAVNNNIDDGTGAVISECESQVRIDTESFTADANIGGITGLNQYNEALIHDSFFGSRGEIRINNSGGSVGGIAGENAGIVSNTYNSATLNYVGATPGNDFGAIVGAGAGTITASYYPAQFGKSLGSAAGGDLNLAMCITTNFSFEPDNSATIPNQPYAPGDYLKIQDFDGKTEYLVIDDTGSVAAASITTNINVTQCPQHATGTISSVEIITPGIQTGAGTLVTMSDMTNFVSLCGDNPSALPTEQKAVYTCPSWDIADESQGYGSERIMDHYRRKYGQAAGNTQPPVWEVGNFNPDGLPELFQSIDD
jgi:hypothetical protein